MRPSSVLALIILVVSTKALIQVDPKTQFFVDEFHRVRLFHGVNAVYKIPPWIPPQTGFDPVNSFSDIDVANLAQWGFTAVRLGVMWPGVMPNSSGIPDVKYLDAIAAIVDRLYSYGIYTILDAHQDVANRRFCGEGFPDWSLPKEIGKPFPAPLTTDIRVNTSTGYPYLEDCLKHEFAEYYLTSAVGASFQLLYENATMKQHFERFWSVVSHRFSGVKGVLGYELINEPWPGDVYADPSLLVPGHADRVHMVPLYSLLNKAIRAEDDNHILFFEKALTDLTGATGFTEGPGGLAYNNRQAYSYHVYCGTDSSGNPRNVDVCDAENFGLWTTFMKDIKTLKTGSFMTEFGAVGNSSNSIEMLEFMTGLADSRLQSWTYWQLKYFQDLTTAGQGESFYHQNGSLDEHKVRALSRSHAYAVAGTPTLMSFNPKTSIFILHYALDTTIKASTEVYINEKWAYAGGYSVVTHPSGVLNWTSTSLNHLSFWPASSARQGINVTITVTPK